MHISITCTGGRWFFKYGYVFTIGLYDIDHEKQTTKIKMLQSTFGGKNSNPKEIKKKPKKAEEYKDLFEW